MGYRASGRVRGGGLWGFAAPLTHAAFTRAVLSTAFMAFSLRFAGGIKLGPARTQHSNANHDIRGDERVRCTTSIRLSRLAQQAASPMADRGGMVDGNNRRRSVDERGGRWNGRFE